MPTYSFDQEDNIKHQNTTGMKTIELINHKGKTIMYQDFSNMRSKEEIEFMVNSDIDYIQKQAPKSVLSFANVENMHFNNEIKDIITNAVKKNEPFVKATVIIGLKGLIAIMYKGFVAATGRNSKLLKTKQEALDYLASIE